MLALVEPFEMLSGEQVAWLDAVQSIRMARGEGPPAVLGRCCNRGDWKPEYDGVKLHVSRPLLIATIWMVVQGVCELSSTRLDLELANAIACARPCKTHAYR